MVKSAEDASYSVGGLVVVSHDAIVDSCVQEINLAVYTSHGVAPYNLNNCALDHGLTNTKFEAQQAIYAGGP